MATVPCVIYAMPGPSDTYPTPTVSVWSSVSPVPVAPFRAVPGGRSCVVFGT